MKSGICIVVMGIALLAGCKSEREVRVERNAQGEVLLDTTDMGLEPSPKYDASRQAMFEAEMSELDAKREFAAALDSIKLYESQRNNPNPDVVQSLSKDEIRAVELRVKALLHKKTYREIIELAEECEFRSSNREELYRNGKSENKK